MSLSHPQIITPTQVHGKNCLPQNQSLVPKRLGTTVPRASELTQITRNVKISYALLRPLLNLYRKNSLRTCRIFISPSLFSSAFQHLFCSIDKVCGNTARILLKTGSSILSGTVAIGNLASPQKLPAHYSSPLLLVLYLRAAQNEFTWPSHGDPSNTEGHILA